jgi:hypothetical protein
VVFAENQLYENASKATIDQLPELTFYDRLFLKDAGIPFEENRYPYDDTWKETSERLKSQGITRTGQLPVVEYKGLKLSQVRFSRFFLLD